MGDDRRETRDKRQETRTNGETMNKFFANISRVWKMEGVWKKDILSVTPL